MVARGWIPRTEVEATLFDAAKDCGLVADDGEVQTRRTIASGLDDGAGAPHPDLPDQDALQESELPLMPSFPFEIKVMRLGELLVSLHM